MVINFDIFFYDFELKFIFKGYYLAIQGATRIIQPKKIGGSGSSTGRAACPWGRPQESRSEGDLIKKN